MGGQFSQLCAELPCGPRAAPKARTSRLRRNRLLRNTAAPQFAYTRNIHAPALFAPMGLHGFPVGNLRMPASARRRVGHRVETQAMAIERYKIAVAWRGPGGKEAGMSGSAEENWWAKFSPGFGRRDLQLQMQPAHRSISITFATHALAAVSASRRLVRLKTGASGRLWIRAKTEAGEHSV